MFKIFNINKEKKEQKQEIMDLKEQKLRLEVDILFTVHKLMEDFSTLGNSNVSMENILSLANKVNGLKPEEIVSQVVNEIKKPEEK